MIPRSEDESEEPRRPRSPRPDRRGGGRLDRSAPRRRRSLHCCSATQVVRNAAVAALATLHPESAAKLWAGHPAVEISLGLAEIGRASRTRTPIDPATFAMIDDAAVKSPLSPDPFLVRGVQCGTRAMRKAAKQAFARGPVARSALFAGGLSSSPTIYFRAGDSLSGLQQTALLARLSPGGTAAVAPFVAAFAASRRTGPRCARCSARNRAWKRRCWCRWRRTRATSRPCSRLRTRAIASPTARGWQRS